MTEASSKAASPQLALLAKCCQEISDAMEASGRSNIKPRILVQEWTELTDPVHTPEPSSPEELQALNARAQSLFNRLKEFVLLYLKLVAL